MATNDLFYGIGLVLFKPSLPFHSPPEENIVQLCQVLKREIKNLFASPFISREVILSIDSKRTSSNVYDPLWNIKCQCRIATHTKKYPFSGQAFQWRQKINNSIPHASKNAIGNRKYRLPRAKER